MLPASWRHQAVEIKNKLWGGFRHHYYSQFGEDIALQSLLKGKTGFYVDVGANHPKRYSNTQLLYERGWHGINIEPNRSAVREFKRQRKRDIIVHCGVGSVEEMRTYYRFSDPAYNTFSKEAADALKEKKWLTPLESEEVPMRPLATILKQYLPHGVQVDFLNVDAEGGDLDVLQSNDWTQFAPQVICVEARGFDVERADESSVYRYLAHLGYHLTSFIGPTLIFTIK
jgi:FkbM family methyltransferase